MDDDTNTVYGHCYKVLVWDETNDGIPYWVAVNSFGKDWGENGKLQRSDSVNLHNQHFMVYLGFFRVKRGKGFYDVTFGLPGFNRF